MTRLRGHALSGVALGLACTLTLARASQHVALEDAMDRSKYGHMVDLFHTWKVMNGKRYGSGEEERAALAAFFTNQEAVEACNAQSADTGFSCALNTFADETHERFSELRLTDMSRMPRSYSHVGQHAPDVFGAASKEVPDAVDWAESDVVTAVEDQGKCASGWAFAAVGALEGLQAIMSDGVARKLSTQQLLSCGAASSSSRGRNSGPAECAGGLPQNAFGWVDTHGGLTEAGTYGSYTAADALVAQGVCACCGGAYGLCEPDTEPPFEHVKHCLPAATCGGYFEVPQDEEVLMDAVAQQPVAAALDASAPAVAFYKGGIYSTASSGEEEASHGRRGRGHDSHGSPNHVMLIVGYGVEGDVPYWLLKNSWGTSWGEGGYMRLRRGKGELGIGAIASYPATPATPPRCAMPVEGDVQLTGQHSDKGVVTMYRQGSWRAVCGDDRDSRDETASLACRQLGYSGLSKVSTYTAHSTALAVSEMSCPRSATSLADCEPKTGLDILDACPSGVFLYSECEGEPASEAVAVCGSALPVRPKVEPLSELAAEEEEEDHDDHDDHSHGLRGRSRPHGRSHDKDEDDEDDDDDDSDKDADDHPHGRTHISRRRRHSRDDEEDDHEGDTPVHIASGDDHEGDTPVHIASGDDHEGDVRVHATHGHEGDVRVHATDDHEGDVRVHATDDHEGDVRVHATDDHDDDVRVHATRRHSHRRRRKHGDDDDDDDDDEEEEALHSEASAHTLPVQRGTVGGESAALVALVLAGAAVVVLGSAGMAAMRIRQRQLDALLTAPMA